MGYKIKIVIGIALTVLLNVNTKQQLTDFFIEKAEYSYNYMLWFLHDDLYFTEKGYRQEDLKVVLYWKADAYYFVPLDECDTEIEINGDVRKVRHNEFQEGKYIFYKMESWTARNLDCESWYIGYEASVSRHDIMGFTYLGIVEIDTTGSRQPEVPPLERNAYIDAAMDYICDEGDLPEGNYKVYIGDYGRYQYHEADQVEMYGIIRQDEIYRPFWARVTRNDDGDYEAFFFHTNGAYELFPPEEDPYRIMLIDYTIQAERLVIDLEITRE